MRIDEIDQKPTVAKGWAAAQLDAEKRGLTLTKNTYSKNWYLTPSNYNEISKELQAKGFSWQDYSMLTANISKLQDYKKAAEDILKNVGSLSEIIQSIKNTKREKAYIELQRLQEESLHRAPHGKPQLFVPRPQVNVKNHPGITHNLLVIAKAKKLLNHVQYYLLRHITQLLVIVNHLILFGQVV
jgi:seryl-tRNA synthetase